MGFDQDLMPPIRTGGIDSVVMERTYDIGHIAMEIMDGLVQGQWFQGSGARPPILMTRENIDLPRFARN